MGRFLSQKVMSQYRHEEAVRNSRVKRGDFKRSNHTAIVVCGCDDDGSCHFEADYSPWDTKKDENRSDQ